MPLQQTQINEAVNYVVNTFTGQRIAMPNGQYHGECTVPIVWYLQHMGLPIPPMHADRADGWGVVNPPELQQFFSFEPFQQGKAYPRGSILMWNSPHIALVLADTGGDNVVTCFEQNADPDGAPCGTHSRTLNTSSRTATYAMVPIISNPEPVIPYTIEIVTPHQKHVIAGHNKWNLNQATFEEITAHPIDTAPDNKIITVRAVLHHKKLPQYNYYLEDPSKPEGWNALDCDDNLPPPPLPAAPLPVKLAEKYILVTTVMAFSNSTDASIHRGQAKPLEAGEYFVIDKKGKAYNLSNDNMKDKQQWINIDDNVPQSEPVLPPKMTEVIQNAAKDIPVPPPIEPDYPNQWKSTNSPLRLDRLPVIYVSRNLSPVKVFDLDKKKDPQWLQPGTMLSIVSTFWKDGVQYGRTEAAAKLGLWYGVPMSIIRPETLYSTITSVAERFAMGTQRLLDYPVKHLAKIEKFIDGIKETKPRR